MASTFRRALSAAAPSGKQWLAPRHAVPPRRLLHSATPGDQAPKSLDDMVNLFNQSIKELDFKVMKRYLLYTSLQKLVEEKKLLNPFVQWSWQVGAVTLIVIAERFMGSTREET